MSGPYMPLFVGDFMASTATWSGPERGLYLQLLMAQWSSGKLPSDPERLARAIGYPLKEFRELWAIVGAKFQERDGSLANDRLEAIRAKSLAIQATNSAKARKAAQSRWDAPSIAPGNASSNAPECHPIQSNPIHIQRQAKKAPNGASAHATVESIRLPIGGLARDENAR